MAGQRGTHVKGVAPQNRQAKRCETTLERRLTKFQPVRVDAKAHSAGGSGVAPSDVTDNGFDIA